MCTLLERVTVKKAKKRHACDAWDWVGEDITALQDDQEYRCKGIKIGDSYNRSRVAGGGEAWTFKACFPCLEMVKKYEINMTGEC